MKLLLSFLITTIFIFPQQTSVQKEIEALNLNSHNYLLYSVEADEVIASKNHDQKLSVASINKVLTTFTAIEMMEEKDLDIEIEITQAMLQDIKMEASIVGFYPGQVITVKEALYGIILSSGADAVNIISHYLTGSVDGIVKEMNKKAKDIGMSKTNIVNASGFDDSKQYTTLTDILILLNTALENDIFYDIYTKKEHALKHNPDFILDNHILTIMDNRNNPYIYGAKSGNTHWAQFALSSIAGNDESNYILITTQSRGYSYLDNGAIEDAITVYDYMFEHYQKETLINKDELKTEIDITYRLKPYPIYHLEEMNSFNNKDFKKEDLKFKFKTKEDLKAPIKKESVLGTYEVYYKDELIYEEETVAHEDISRSLIFNVIFVVIGIVLSILAAFILYLLFQKLQLEYRKNKSKY